MKKTVIFALCLTLMVPLSAVAANLLVTGDTPIGPQSVVAADDSQVVDSQVVRTGDTLATPSGDGHPVVTGDTLWDLSDEFRQNPFTWPKLWSENPHIYNPHWIFPGDIVYLYGKPAPKQEVREIRLVVERLTPPEPEVVDSGEMDADAGEEFAYQDYEFAPAGPTFVYGKAQDYISEKKVARKATIDNKALTKMMYAEDEEVEFAVENNSSIAVGDDVAIFDDSRFITHPNTGAPQGYQVRVVGYGKVLAVEEGHGRLQILNSFDTIKDGYGVVAKTDPVMEVTISSAPEGLSGTVLAGKEQLQIFADTDIVFLDKGETDGLKPGAKLDIPIKPRHGAAQGMVVDLASPMAVIVVVSTRANTSTAVVLASRMTVEAGQPFVASAVSP